MTNAFSDANAIVNQVNQNGGESAARLMMDSISNAREDFKEPSLNKVGNGYNNYMTVLSEELQKSGVLPELSVGWAKANIDVIGNGRSISDNDIRKFEHQADNSTNPVDQMMIKSLNDQAPDLKKASKDQRGPETVITFKDLNKRLGLMADYRQYSLPDELGKNPNSHRAQVLFQKGENGRDLFDFLDGIRDKGERDGKVDRNDLVTFNEMAKNEPEFRANFTPEQIQTVQELETRWDYEGGQIHDQGFFKQELTRDSIAKGLGFEDVHIPAEVPMAKALNHPHDLEKPRSFAHRIIEPTINDGNNRDAIDQSRGSLLPESERDDNRNAIRDSEVWDPQGELNMVPKTFEGRDAINEAVSDVFRDATQRVGEGPYQVASRLLPGASHGEIMELTKAMKNDYQQTTGDRTDRMAHMQVGEHLINRQNLQRILAKSLALQNRLRNCARR